MLLPLVGSAGGVVYEVEPACESIQLLTGSS